MSATEKCFANGSAYPPLVKGQLRLYSMRFCPFAQRTRLVLAYKNIPHETINIHLREKPDWFLERNPFGLVPVLEQDDKIVYESLVTCDYMDNIYPDNRLIPTDPFKKARDDMLVDYFGKTLGAHFYKFLGNEGKDEKTKDTLIKFMNKMEKEITARGKFFGGDKPAMVDMMMWPWFERIGVMQTVAPSLVPSQTAFPKLFSWMQAMFEEPAIKATCFDVDSHTKFVAGHLQGKADYDIGLEP